MSAFVNKTIGQIIQEAAQNYPENPALIQPEDTTETIDKEGWLHTGDLGEVDQNGKGQDSEI